MSRARADVPARPHRAAGARAEGGAARGQAQGGHEGASGGQPGGRPRGHRGQVQNC